MKSSKASKPDSTKKHSNTKSVHFRDSGQYQDLNSPSEQKEEKYSEVFTINPQPYTDRKQTDKVREVHNNSSNKKYERNDSDMSNPASAHLPSTARESVMFLNDVKSAKKQLHRPIIYKKSVLVNNSFQFPSFEKTSNIRALITNAISGNFIFEGLDSETLSILVDAFEHREVEKEEIIIREGHKGDYFYIIEHGSVEFSKMIKESVKVVGRAGKSQTFGDLALLHDCPRAATCIALETCHLWRVDQEIFRQVLAKQRQSKDNEIITILRKVKLFSNFTNENLGKLANIATSKHYAKGQYIIKKGGIGREFYILKEGVATVRNIMAGGASYEDQTLSQGDYFGERAILTSENRVADVVADESCVILCLTKKQFIDSVGSIEDSFRRMSDFRVLVSHQIISHYLVSNFNGIVLNTHTSE